MSTNNEHKVSCKVWLELRGEPLIGKGGAKILETIKQVQSISNAAKTTGMSYRYVWNYLSKLERRLGEPVVTTFKGGSKGGGGAKLTKLGIKLLNEYKQAEVNLRKSMLTQTNAQIFEAENRLEGTIQKLNTKTDFFSVEFTTESPVKLTLNVSKQTVKELNLLPEDKIEVKIKDSCVRITKENVNKD